MRYDEIGTWSEIKLEIIKDYASAYTKILSKQKWCKGYVYIDAFAGAGMHISKRTGKLVPGSPLNALEISPPFTEYHFIDIDENRAKGFEELAEKNPNIYPYHGDCNEILIGKIFPLLPYAKRKRALCFLDPYKLNLKWQTIQTAGKLKTIDIFLNFSVMDANRNILFENLSTADPKDVQRMDEFWGDNNWRNLLYRETKNLFGERHQLKVDDFRALAKEFCKRLKNAAGFEFVPEPILMTNAKNGPLYYLFFASHKDVANNIINYIFGKYRKKLQG